MAAMGMATAPARRLWGQPMPIRSYLQDHHAFQPDEIDAMSRALEETYTALHVKALRSL